MNITDKGLNNNLTLKDIVSLILFLALLAVPTYLAYRIFVPRIEIFDQEEENITGENKSENDITEEEILPTTIICEEDYEILNIGGYTVYISYPNEKESEPANILIYGHGSTTVISEDLNTEDMKDMQNFANTFNNSNYVFAVLEQEYDLWDREMSERYTYEIYQHILNSCNTTEKVSLLGYSKGGSPTLNFASTYPDIVERVALLAPTIRMDQWDSARVRTIQNIDFKIWHGDMDVNIPLYKTQNFVDFLKENGKDVQFETMNGTNHWYLYDRHMDAVLEFLTTPLPQ